MSPIPIDQDRQYPVVRFLITGPKEARAEFFAVLPPFLLTQFAYRRNTVWCRAEAADAEQLARAALLAEVTLQAVETAAESETYPVLYLAAHGMKWEAPE